MSSLRVWQSVLVLLSMCFSVLSLRTEEEKDDEEEDDKHTQPVVVDVVKSILTVAGNVWNDEVLQNAVTLRRAIRSVGRVTRNVPTLLGPILASLSNIIQVFSYLPGVIELLVSGVSSFVDITGKGIVILANGMDASASAMDSLGRSVQRLSSSVPSLVTAFVMGGGFLTIFFPNIQDAVIATAAKLGLM
ncbi:uncharacterized protein [Palaemon carinicauda]